MTTLWDLNESLLDRKYRDWRSTAHGGRVYAEVCRRALALKRSGHRHLGMKAIFESIRYDVAVGNLGFDTEGFRLNNNYTAPMTRELEEDHPELRGFFEKRVRRALV